MDCLILIGLEGVDISFVFPPFGLKTCHDLPVVIDVYFSGVKTLLLSNSLRINGVMEDIRRQFESPAFFKNGAERPEEFGDGDPPFEMFFLAPGTGKIN